MRRLRLRLRLRTHSPAEARRKGGFCMLRTPFARHARPLLLLTRTAAAACCAAAARTVDLSSVGVRALAQPRARLHASAAAAMRVAVQVVAVVPDYEQARIGDGRVSSGPCTGYGEYLPAPHRLAERGW